MEKTLNNLKLLAGQKKMFWIGLVLCIFFTSLASAKDKVNFVPGQILIKPKAGLSETNFTGKLKKHGGVNRKTIRRMNVRVVSVSEENADAVLAALKNDPDIEFAERDFIAEAAFIPNDTYSGNEWHLTKIQAMQAWDSTIGSTIVAVLDSGVNTAHPDLAGQLLAGFDFVNNTAVMSDDFGHGTAVCGTVAALGNNSAGVAGVAFGCKILPVKIMDMNGFAAYSAIAQGIRYAVDNGARVINLSIAGSSPSATLQDAIDYAWSSNVVVVAAAGNFANSTVQYPAGCNHVIAVSATEPDDSLASFSSFGSYVTVSAPGDDIWTTQRDLNNPYGSWRGTSFASPIVAAVIALMASANPTLTCDQLVTMLKQTSEDIGAAGYDQYFGFGRVNAMRALSAASSAPGTIVSNSPSTPSASIVSPLTASQFNFGANILIQTSASASMTNTVITNVTLCANGAAIASGANNNFSFNWMPTQAGNYQLTAIVSDSQGLCATSAPVSIQVLSAEIVAPTVMITSAPKPGARVTTPQVLLGGTASDNAGLARIEVQVNNGQNQIANGTTSWTAQVNLAPGVNTVRVRSVDAAGNVSPEVIRTFTYVAMAPLNLNINGLGTVSPNLNGAQLEVGRTYTVKSVPAAGQAFAGWSGVPSQAATLTFMMQSNLTVTANFVPSPFPAVKGNYAGLAANTNGVTPDNSGYFTLSVTTSGAFSGKLFISGNRYSFRGQFNINGDAAVAVNRGTGFSPLNLTLHIDLSNGTDLVTGFLTDGAWISEVMGDRNVFNTQFNPAKQAGLCNFILQRADNANIKAATGSGAISPSGIAQVKGQLDDGRAFRTSSLLSKSGDCPFFLSLNRGTEVVIGWLNFPTNPSPIASGTVLWVRTGTNSFQTTLKAASAP